MIVVARDSCQMSKVLCVVIKYWSEKEWNIIDGEVELLMDTLGALTMHDGYNGSLSYMAYPLIVYEDEVTLTFWNI